MSKKVVDFFWGKHATEEGGGGGYVLYAIKIINYISSTLWTAEWQRFTPLFQRYTNGGSPADNVPVTSYPLTFWFPPNVSQLTGLFSTGSNAKMDQNNWRVRSSTRNLESLLIMKESGEFAHHAGIWRVCSSTRNLESLLIMKESGECTHQPGIWRVHSSTRNL